MRLSSRNLDILTSSHICEHPIRGETLCKQITCAQHLCGAKALPQHFSQLAERAVSSAGCRQLEWGAILPQRAPQDSWWLCRQQHCLSVGAHKNSRRWSPARAAFYQACLFSPLCSLKGLRDSHPVPSAVLPVERHSEYPSAAAFLPHFPRPFLG